MVILGDIILGALVILAFADPVIVVSSWVYNLVVRIPELIVPSRKEIKKGDK